MTTYNQPMNQPDRVLSWDDTIQKDSEFVLLPEGVYYFTVSGLERAQYTPGPNSKIPACPQAKITIKIPSAQGKATVRHNLFLYSSNEGLLSAFFGAIGLKQKNAPLQMDFNNIMGKSGYCRIKMRTYNGDQYNEVKAMLYPDEVNPAQVLNAQFVNGGIQQAAPAMQAAPAAGPWNNGAF